MPILKPSENFEKVHIPANVYAASLNSVRELEIDDKEKGGGAKKTVLVWAFDIVGKNKTVTVEGITSYAFSAKSKARPWVVALMGGAQPEGAIDTDELVGNPCRVRVEDKERDGVPYSGVADVFAPAVEGEEGF